MGKRRIHLPCLPLPGMISSFFRQPHPLSDEWKSSFGSAVLAGILVALFLIIFQPFGTYHWQHPQKYLLLCGYGLITFGVILFFGGGLQRLFPKLFREEYWTLGHEVLFQLLGIMLIAILNYFYSLWLGNRLSPEKIRLGDFLYMIWATVTIGLFPTLVFTSLAQIRNKKHYAPAIQLHSVKAVEVPDQEMRFTADNGKDIVAIQANELRFISAADNYIEIHFVKNGNPTKELLRASLTRISEESNRQVLFRCHRSYLVYLPAVRKVSGNAQGYKLHFSDYPAIIPVGRSFSVGLLAALKS